MADRLRQIQDNPFKSVIYISIPLVIIFFLNTMYGIVDVYWIGFLGQSAVIAVGYIANVSYAFNKIGDGIARSTSVLITNSFGSKDYGRANNIALHGILIIIVLSIIMPIIALLLIEPVFSAIGVGAYADLIIGYLYAPLIFTFIIMMSSFFSTLLGSEGDTKRVSYILTASNVLNMALEPIFIFHLNLGMFGAGLATTICCIFSCMIFVYLYFNKKDIVLDLHLSQFSFDRLIIREIVVVAVPLILSGVIIAFSGFLINYSLLLYAPEETILAFVILLRLQTLFYTPIQGLCKGLCIVVGHLFGAERFKTIRSTASKTAKVGVVMGLVIAVVLVIFIKPIMGLFTADPVVFAETENLLIFVVMFMLLHPIIVSCTYTLIGMKKSHYSLYFIILNVALFAFFAITLHSLFNLGKYAVFVSILLSDIVQTIVIVILLKRKLGEYIIEENAVDACEFN